jgi:phage terminase large subunit-like protein
MKRISKEAIERLAPEEQQRVLKRMELMREYKRVNPLFFFNHPTMSARPVHQKQMEWINTQIKIKALFGGNQSGKTTGAIADCLIQAHDIDVLPEHLKPAKKWHGAFKCRIFTPDLSDTMYTVQQKVKDLVCQTQLIGDSWDSAYNKVERLLRFKNGSFFQFMSYDQDLQKLGSATLHRIYYDEEPPYKVFEECQPRLTRYGGDQVFAMTPLQGMTWMYKDIWEASGGDDTDFTKWKFINPVEKKACVVLDMEDNPYISQENMEDTLKGYSAESLRARKEGRFVHFAGLIYTEFREKEAVIPQRVEKPFAAPLLRARDRQANIIVGIDPGLRFTAVLWAAVDEDQNMTIFNELFVSDWTIQEICKQIHMENQFHIIKPMYNIIDPHARDRSKQTGRSDQSEFTKNGIYTILGQNNVQTGIDAVKQRLKDGKLVIQSNCENLIREFKIYRYKEQSKRIESEVSAEPIKKDDHCLDALRYIVMSRPYAPEYDYKDERTWDEKWMDEDKETASIPEVPASEFGTAIFL